MENLQFGLDTFGDRTVDDRGVPVSYAQVLRDVVSQGVLADADLAELDWVLAGRAAEGHSAFAQAWAAGDAQIRNTAAKARGAKLGVEAKPFLKSHPGYAVWLDKEVTDALAKASPLAREMGLDLARWKFVEDLARADASGLPAVRSSSCAQGIVILRGPGM